jgi:hypothetical protein
LDDPQTLDDTPVAIAIDIEPIIVTAPDKSATVAPINDLEIALRRDSHIPATATTSSDEESMTQGCQCHANGAAEPAYATVVLLALAFFHRRHCRKMRHPT